MTRFLKYFLLCVSLGISSLSYATMATLTVNNHLKGIDIYITNDLICGAPSFSSTIGAGNTWYKTPLDENPIKPSQSPVKATWQNCVIAEKYFSEYGDHNNIYVTLKNSASPYYTRNTLQTSDSTVLPFTLHVFQGQRTTTINYGGKNITITMSHSGNYTYHGPFAHVGPTDTSISFDE